MRAVEDGTALVAWAQRQPGSENWEIWSSGFGEPVPQAPGIVYGLAAEPDDGQVTLSWNSRDDANSYTLYWSTSPDVTPQTGTAIPNATSPYVHSGLSNGTTLYYLVTASNSFGESDPSPVVQATPAKPRVWLPQKLVEQGTSDVLDFDLTVDSAGSVSLVWLQNQNFLFRRLDATTQSWLPAEPVDQPRSGDARTPKVSTSGDQAIVIWKQAAKNGWSLYSNTWSPSQSWVGGSEFYKERSSTSFNLVDIEMAPQGSHGVLSWISSDQTEFYVKRYENGWQQDEVAYTSGASDLLGGAIAVNDNGRVGAAVRKSTSSYVSIYTPGFGWFGPETDGEAVEDIDFGFDNRAMTVEIFYYSPNNDYRPAINQYRPSDTEGYDKGGGWPLENSRNWIQDVRVAFSEDEREAVVTYVGEYAGTRELKTVTVQNIYTYIDNGNLTGRATLDTGNEDVLSSDMVADGYGNLMAIYRQSNGTEIDLWGVQYRVDSGWNDPFLIESDVGNVGSAKVVASPDGDFAVSWTQTQNGETSLWMRRYAVDVGTQNQAPSADAGVDQAVDEGTGVVLDGSGSSDPDGTIAGYAWTQTAGPAVTLSGADTVNPSFTSPMVSSDTVLSFELTVTDDQGATGSDIVDVIVQETSSGGDTTAPVTTASITSTSSGNQQTFDITLTPDEPATTTFRITGTFTITAGGTDTTAWQTYSGPIQGDKLKKDKPTLEFYSTDTSGNQEATQSEELK